MNRIDTESITQYVERYIGEFHDKRLRSLDNLKLKDVLKRKNPYLFRPKNVLTSEQIVRGFVDTHLSSNEETLFGDWLPAISPILFVKKMVPSTGSNWCVSILRSNARQANSNGGPVESVPGKSSQGALDP